MSQYQVGVIKMYEKQYNISKMSMKLFQLFYFS